MWKKCAAKTIGHRSKRDWSFQFQGPDPEESVIRHGGKVQALGREAHRSQGANVDIAVVHWGVELGVAGEKETER